MQVKDCMTRNVITVKKSTSLRELIGKFRKHNFHMFPVVDNDNKMLGIITFLDVLKAFQPYGADLRRMLKTMPLLFLDDDVEEDLVLTEISGEMGLLLLVDDLMTTRFVTTNEESEVLEVRGLMRVHQLEVLPVVKDDILIGVVSLFDLIISIFKEKGLID